MKNTNAKLKVQASKVFKADVENSEEGVIIGLPKDIANHLNLKGRELQVHCIVVNGVLQVSGEQALAEIPVVNPEVEFANIRA